MFGNSNMRIVTNSSVPINISSLMVAFIISISVSPLNILESQKFRKTFIFSVSFYTENKRKLIFCALKYVRLPLFSAWRKCKAKKFKLFFDTIFRCSEFVKSCKSCTKQSISGISVPVSNFFRSSKNLFSRARKYHFCGSFCTPYPGREDLFS